jgi:hypothetical protein
MKHPLLELAELIGIKLAERWHKQQTQIQDKRILVTIL